MAIPYDEWIKQASAERVLLCEMEGFHNVRETEETFYMSTRSANDFQHYLPLILKTPIIQRSINRDLISSLQLASGFIEVDLNNGDLDALIYHSFRGRAITFRHGDISWNIADFEVIYVGVVSDFEIVDDNTIRIDFTSGESLLDVPVNPERITISPDPDSQLPSEVFAPLCYGRNYGIEPMLLNFSSREYKVHNGSILGVLAVFADGNTIGAEGGNWVRVNGSGGFALTNNTYDGQTITCDVDGAESGGLVLEKIGEVVLDILTTFGTHSTGAGVATGHLPLSKIDTASLTDFDLDSPRIGFYSGSNPTSLLVALQAIVGSHVGWFDFDRRGMFRLSRLLLIEKTVDQGTGLYNSVEGLGNPSLGEFGFEGSDLVINKEDAEGLNRTDALALLKQHDEVYIVDNAAPNRWVDYRVVTNTNNTLFHYLECNISSIGSQPLLKNRSCSISITVHDKISGTKPTTIWLNDNNIIGELSVSHDQIEPTFETAVGFRHNTSKQSNGKEWMYAKFVDANADAIKAKYAEAKAQPPLLTLISGKGTDAIDQAELRQALRADQHYYIMPKTHLVGFKVNLGDIGEISTSRFLLEDKRFVVVFIEEDMLDSVITLGGWF